MLSFVQSIPLRVTQLLIGLLLYGVAIALIVLARLGVDPWDVFGQGVATLSGVPFGLVTNMIGGAVLLLWWPLHQRPGVGTVANVLLVGSAAGVALLVIPTVENLGIRIGFLVGGIVLLAVATGLYVGAGLGAGPRDGLMLGIQSRFGMPIWLSRTLIEGSVVLAGWLLGGDVGFGTIAFALTIGPLCGVAIPLFASGAQRDRRSRTQSHNEAIASSGMG